MDMTKSPCAAQVSTNLLTCQVYNSPHEGEGKSEPILRPFFIIPSPDCLTGKSETLLSSPLAKNIPLYALVGASLEPSPSRPTHKGRFAIVTDVGHGMRWTLKHA